MSFAIWYNDLLFKLLGPFHVFSQLQILQRFAGGIGREELSGVHAFKHNIGSKDVLFAAQQLSAFMQFVVVEANGGSRLRHYFVYRYVSTPHLLRPLTLLLP